MQKMKSIAIAKEEIKKIEEFQTEVKWAKVWLKLSRPKIWRK